MFFWQSWPQKMLRGVTTSNLYERKSHFSDGQAVGVCSGMGQDVCQGKIIYFPAGVSLLHHYWCVDCSKLQGTMSTKALQSSKALMR